MANALEPVKLTDELKDSLKEIVKDCEREDRDIWKAQVRMHKKAEEFWHGVQFLFWSDTTDSWRSPQSGLVDDETDDENQLGSFSDKVVDIYKAHGEGIIAALAAQIPALRFLPDDADQTEDVLTARTRSKIADLLQRHNKAKLVFLKALYYLVNFGIVASYRYYDTSFEYGSHQIPKMGVQDTEQPVFTCKECDYQAPENWAPNPCPQCGSVDAPKESVEKAQVPVQEGVEDKPKTRVKFDVFGPLHFKVSQFARTQQDCSYFGLLLDQGKDTVMEQFPDLYDDIEADRMEDYDRFSRAIYSYPNDEEIDKNNLVTVGRWWLRPRAFYREKRKDKREALLKKFPDGCKVTLIGKKKTFAEVIPESLDKRWELGQAGISTYIYADATLRPLMEIQEMRNTLVNLIIETIRHGIPSEFADPKVVNFDTYGRFEAVPGYIYQTKPGRPGEPIGNSFYTSSRSTLSREVAMFLKQLDQDAQFSIGSFPSIYGGPSEGKSRTFAEYAASGQIAMRRLSILWNLAVDWWVRTVAGGVDMYVDTIVEDEKFATFQNGDYINTWIKMSQLQGKIGGVEPEGAEGFPISLAQKKDLILKFMELNNPFINNVLYKPDNAKIMQDVMGLTELKIPGEEQRIKQVIEINEMVRGGEAPVSTGEPDMQGQEILQSTVPIDPDVDDHPIHIATIISYLVDIPGLELMREKPEAYANVIAHLRAHQMAEAAKTMMPGGGGTAAGVPPPTAQAGVEA